MRMSSQVGLAAPTEPSSITVRLSVQGEPGSVTVRLPVQGELDPRTLGIALSSVLGLTSKGAEQTAFSLPASLH